jgi:hypothetical protein
MLEPLSVLRELVDLKRLHDGIEAAEAAHRNFVGDKPLPLVSDEYATRKDAAWKSAFSLVDTDRAEPMQGLADYLHNLATSMEDEDAETLRRWADEIEASRQRPAAQAASATTLREAADALLEAGHEFWLACRRDAGGGAVRWLTASDGALIIFTRGEYRDRLLAAIRDDYAAPELVFSDAGDGEEDEVDAFVATPRPAAPAPAPETEAPYPKANYCPSALATPAQAPWKAISDAIRKVTGHPDLTSGSLSLLGEIIRALAQASPASDAWRCACGSALYIDAEGKPRSKAADGVKGGA